MLGQSVMWQGMVGEVLNEYVHADLINISLGSIYWLLQNIRQSKSLCLNIICTLLWYTLIVLSYCSWVGSRNRVSSFAFINWTERYLCVSIISATVQVWFCHYGIQNNQINIIKSELLYVHVQLNLRFLRLFFKIVFLLMTSNCYTVKIPKRILYHSLAVKRRKGLRVWF